MPSAYGAKRTPSTGFSRIAASTTSGVIHAGWEIIIVQSHALFSRAAKTAGSSALHSPSSGPTVWTRPSSAFAIARTV